MKEKTMKQFCKKISLLLAIVVGTSIAQEGPLQKLPTETLGDLLPDIQLVVAQQMIQSAVDYMRQYLRLAYTVQVPFVNSIAFSPDGKTISTGSDDNTVKIWNAQTDQWIQTLQDPAIPGNTTHGGLINSIALSPDSRTIITGSWDKTVKKWNVHDGQLIDTLRDPAIPGNITHGGMITSIALSPDGKTISTGSDDNTVKIWASQIERKQKVLGWLEHNIRPDQAVVIARLYENKKLVSEDDLSTFNTMPKYVRSFLIEYLYISTLL